MRLFLLFIVVFICSNLFSQGVFFDSESEWKYLDNGTDQGFAWQSLNFDDSSWETGSGHIGFGDGDEDTEIESGHICYYFRKKVMIDDITAFDTVYFSIVHDDGMVLYINESEAVRSDLMPQSGTINYNTSTTEYISTSSENNFWRYAVSADYFVEGENIIAISVHNQSTSSSDISFACKTSGHIEYEPDGPYVFYRNNEIIVKSLNANGYTEQTYTNPEDVTLTCYFPEYTDSFSLELMPELNIENSSFDVPNEFYAISDIEGNLEGFAMILKNSGIVDDNYNWNFGTGHLVLVGDMFDRGNNVTECLWLLYKLDYQSKAVGGKVHFVLGNHDIMNLIHDFRYVNQKYIDNASVMGESLESFYADNTEFGRWLRTKNIIEEIGNFTFVHAGVSMEVADLSLTYEEINNHGRYRMDNNCITYDCNIVNGGSDYGLYWYRGIAYEEETQEEVDEILELIDTEKMIIGHTVMNNISLLYNNSVIAIDLDHEENVESGFMHALYYENGCFYDFYTDGNNSTTLLECTNTGVDKAYTDNSIKMYPNPALDKIYVECASSNQTIKIVDSTGKILRQQDVNECGTHCFNLNFEPGIYFLHIQNKNGVEKRKIILR